MLDIKMPGKSGKDLLPELKAGYPGMAVIMATAVAEAHLAIQCMRLGADDYITKPFSLNEVVMSVEKVLEKRLLELKIWEYQETAAAKSRNANTGNSQTFPRFHRISGICSGSQG